ncbi:MAG: hypothetical protein ACHQRJ_14475 [Alphaproteobacteria bacterium]
MARSTKTCNPEQLKWIWSYREQLKLLDKFDAEGIRCAKNGWDNDSWARFLNTYGLNQGHQAEFRHKREKVLRAIDQVFKPELCKTGTVGELTNRWKKSVSKIGCLAKKKKKNGGNPELWSMASKLFWFYQPTEMTMYDSNAVKGLKAVSGCVITPQNFLEKFEELFKNKQTSISEAANFSDREYPYPRRVLDKWLWLKGSGKEAVYLHQFQWSLELAPIRRACTNQSFNPRER